MAISCEVLGRGIQQPGRATVAPAHESPPDRRPLTVSASLALRGAARGHQCRPCLGRGTTVPGSGLTQTIPGSRSRGPCSRRADKEHALDQSEAPMCSELGKTTRYDIHRERRSRRPEDSVQVASVGASRSLSACPHTLPGPWGKRSHAESPCHQVETLLGHSAPVRQQARLRGLPRRPRPSSTRYQPNNGMLTR